MQAGLINVLDVNGILAGPFAPLQTGFQESQAAQLAYYESAAGGSPSPAAAQLLIVENYHTSVVPLHFGGRARLPQPTLWIRP